MDCLKHLFVVGSGIGNQIQTIPAFMYLQEQTEIDVVNCDGTNWEATCWLFKPLGAKVLREVDVRDYQGQYLTLLCQRNPIDGISVISRDTVHFSDKHSEVRCNLWAVGTDDWTMPEGFLNCIPPMDTTTVLIHDGYARNTALTPWEAKSWPGHLRASQRLREKGVSVGSIGGREEHVEGTEDFTGSSLRDTIARLKGTKVLLSNDSGMYHLACAVGTPCVVVFTFTSHIKNYDPNFHRLASIIRRDLDCSPCQTKVFDPNDTWLKKRDVCKWACRDVPVDEVVSKVLERL